MPKKNKSIYITQKGINRLKQLITHCRSGKLYHDKFDFSDYFYIYESDEGKFDMKSKSLSCKTAGCFAGELLGCSKDWGIKGNHLTYLRGDSDSQTHPMLGLEQYLETILTVVEHLFVPNSQFSGRSLSAEASLTSVLNNAEKFVELYESEKLDAKIDKYLKIQDLLQDDDFDE